MFFAIDQSHVSASESTLLGNPFAEKAPPCGAIAVRVDDNLAARSILNRLGGPPVQSGPSGLMWYLVSSSEQIARYSVSDNDVLEFPPGAVRWLLPGGVLRKMTYRSRPETDSIAILNRLLDLPSF